jgi:hypothetical protein
VEGTNSLACNLTQDRCLVILMYKLLKTTRLGETSPQSHCLEHKTLCMKYHLTTSLLGLPIYVVVV